MARHHDRDFDRVFNFARSALYIKPVSDTMTTVGEDEGLVVDLDEPPDRHITRSPQSYVSSATDATFQATRPEDVYCKKSAAPMARQSSLLTAGLLTAANLRDIPLTSSAHMSRTTSQMSAFSLTSNHGLTSDGGMSSPTHTGTPSPPLPPITQTGFPAAAPATRTIRFAGEKPPPTQDAAKAPAPSVDEPIQQPRKTRISFACALPRPATEKSEPVTPAPNTEADPGHGPQRACTIKFACPTVPSTATANAAPLKHTIPIKNLMGHDKQSAPSIGAVAIIGSRQSRGSQSTILGKGSQDKVASGNAISPTELRKLEKKKKLKQLTGIRPEDEDWMNEEPKSRKPITVSDTLRKENAIRKLAEEASEELDEEDDVDDYVDEEDDDDDLPATGSRYMAFDDDESDGGHETDDEEGFAESDDDSDDDPDFQFWTTATSVPAPPLPVDEQLEGLKPHHHRTASESSLDSHIKHDSSSVKPKPFLSINGNRRRKSPRDRKMRPGTPELPDSTDFVCGTLDEDRPLEEAYLSCIKQRKLEKRGIIPQDLDPSFPTSDPENIDDEEDDEDTEGLASTASDHHFLGGRFDESEASPGRGRVDHAASPANHNSPRRLRSPAPKPRFKSAVPTAVQLRAKSPAPRKLFGRSPLRARSPAPAQMVKSPPASPKNISFKAPQLAQRNMPFRTASLPHTPNPFFVAHARRMRARSTRQANNLEAHDRGPIDIKQGLEARKQRRKEQYWRRHCRDHKDRSRRCAPGKGAERMRELGIEMAHRNRAYGQKLQLMLSV